MTAITSAEDCSDIAVTCLASTAQQLLGWETTTIEDHQGPPFKNAIFARIPVNTDSFSLNITVAISAIGAEFLVREMLMCAENEPLPEDTNLADSVGEFCNLAAGEMKKRLHALGHIVTIGVPTIACGNVPEAIDNNTFNAWKLELGPIQANLYLN